MSNEIELEEIGFGSEGERKRFVIWLDSLISRGLVERVQAESARLLETKFYRVVGDSQIWTLSDLFSPDHTDKWGYFAKLKIPPTKFEEKTFKSYQEYQSFLSWIESRIEIESVTELIYQSENLWSFTPIVGHRYFYATGKYQERWELVPYSSKNNGMFRRKS